MTLLIAQVGNSMVRLTEPPTKFAIDVLYNHYIRVNIRLVYVYRLRAVSSYNATGLSATIVADRLCISMSVISPKKSPAPRRAMSITHPILPRLRTESSPERTINIERPGSPSATTVEPASKWRSTSIEIRRSRLDSERPPKKGVSTKNAFSSSEQTAISLSNSAPPHAASPHLAPRSDFYHVSDRR